MNCIASNSGAQFVSGSARLRVGSQVLLCNTLLARIRSLSYAMEKCAAPWDDCPLFYSHIVHSVDPSVGSSFLKTEAPVTMKF